MEIAEPRVVDVRLKDHVSETTRKERRYLLAVGFGWIVVAKAGLVPTEITNLGIRFSEVNQSVLLKAAAAAVAYFLVAFLIHGLHDYLSWRLALARALQTSTDKDWAIGQTRIRNTPAGSRRAVPRWRQYLFGVGDAFQPSRSEYRKALRWGNRVRNVFEFVVPVATGVYALHSLWRAW